MKRAWLWAQGVYLQCIVALRKFSKVKIINTVRNKKKKKILMN